MAKYKYTFGKYDHDGYEKRHDNGVMYKLCMK